MGNLLGSPNTEKETHTGKTFSENLEYGVSTMQGWRIHMEDAHICESSINLLEDSNNSNASANSEISLFAVFDGHGGTYAAQYSAKHFVRVFSSQTKFQEFCAKQQQTLTNLSESEKALKDREELELLECALTDAFLELDDLLYESTQQKEEPTENNQSEDAEMTNNDEGDEDDDHLNDESGTTAVIVLLTPKWLICANAGDSRAVYSKAFPPDNTNQAVPLSYDHKPDDEEEERRIIEAQGYVSGGRVDGDLAVSRGFGDFRFKSNSEKSKTEQRVIALPDIIVHNRDFDGKDKFLVLACDGIWDVFTNKECVDCIHQILDEGEKDFGLLCEEVLDLALDRGSKDNMTCLIVRLPGLTLKDVEDQEKEKAVELTGVLARREQRRLLQEQAQEQARKEREFLENKHNAILMMQNEDEDNEQGQG